MSLSFPLSSTVAGDKSKRVASWDRGLRRGRISDADYKIQVKHKNHTHLLREWAGFLYPLQRLRGSAQLEYCVVSLSLAQVIMTLAVSGPSNVWIQNSDWRKRKLGMRMCKGNCECLPSAGIEQTVSLLLCSTDCNSCKGHLISPVTM